MKGFLRLLLAWTWEFPQMLAGYVKSRMWWQERLRLDDSEIAGVAEYERKHHVLVYVSDYYEKRKHWLLGKVSGSSMGMFICVHSLHDIEVVKHEGGHTIQSMILGPLYLPVLGVSSALLSNVWQRVFQKYWEPYDRIYWYYLKRWCERWADILGKVDRHEEMRKVPRNIRKNYIYPPMIGQVYSDRA